MKPRHYILDAENHTVEVDLHTWAVWFQEASNRVVGWIQVTSAITVSTIFLGIDHRHDRNGPPILFETMVMGGPLDGVQNRYCSHDDAVTGHQAVVAKCRAAIGQKISHEAKTD